MGACGFALPPISLLLVSDIKFDTFLKSVVLVELLSVASTGISTTLFQFSDWLRWAYIWEIRLVMLANV